MKRLPVIAAALAATALLLGACGSGAPGAAGVPGAAAVLGFSTSSVICSTQTRPSQRRVLWLTSPRTGNARTSSRRRSSQGMISALRRSRRRDTRLDPVSEVGSTARAYARRGRQTDLSIS